MAWEITRILWLEDIVEKLRWKHNIEESEIIEVLENHPRFVRKEAGFFPERTSTRLLGEQT
jgi:energy-converting hydrogenase A subunit M